MAAVACIGLAGVAGACGKQENLHPQVLLEFPNALPSAPRAVTQNVAPAWTSGHGLAVDGDRLLVVDRDNGDLVAMDRATLAVTGRVAVGGRPEQVVVGPDGAALVTVRRSGEVVHVDAALNVVARSRLGAEAWGIALGVDGLTAYVTLPYDRELVVLSAGDLAERDRVATAELPRGVAVSPAGWVVVVHQNLPAMTYPLDASGLLETEWTEPTALRMGNPADLVSGARLEGLHQLRALAAAIDVETGGALIAHVQAAPGSEADFELAAHGAVFPDGGGAGASDAGGGYGSSSASGGASFEPPVRPIEVSVTTIEPSGASGQLEGSLPVQDLLTGEPMTHLVDQPSDIQHSPTETIALVTGYGSDNVLVLNTAASDPMVSPVAIITVGRAPRAVAFAPEGDLAYVLNDHDLTISVIDLTALAAMPLATVDPNAGSGSHDAPSAKPFASSAFRTETTYPTRPVRLEASRAVAFGQDPLAPEVRRGARVFAFSRNARMSHAGQFACASCHFEGTEDKLTWFITDGPRQTPSLAGRLLDTAPYNWNGSEDELQGNMAQTVERMGGAGLSQTELADLEQFLLYGLEPPRNPNLAPDGQLNAQQAWGDTIFRREDTGCVGCHRGNAFTDGFTHEVGTASEIERRVHDLRLAMGIAPEGELGRLNTPTLRGLFYTAPYLHDGSAPTLRDVLERTADTMGHTSQLSEEEREALIAYLLTL